LDKYCQLILSKCFSMSGMAYGLEDNTFQLIESRFDSNKGKI